MLLNGGYYSLTVVTAIAVLSIIFKKFREILLSFLLAIFGICLLIFVYQAYLDFHFIPEI